MAIRKPTCPMNPEAFHAAADLAAKRRREAVDENQLRAALEGAEHGLRAAAFALSILPAAELPGLKQGKLVFWSTNPVICESL